MPRHRLRFKKEGKAIYLSHLDLMRTVQRVFLRAGIRIRHTEGFNPHAYISVALPLSVGVESECELLDFEIVDGTPLDTLPERLTALLPEGITVLEAYETETKLKEIVWLRLTGALEYDGVADTTDTAARLAAFFGEKEIVIQKRTKKKTMKDLDIAPMIRELHFTPAGPERIKLETVLAAQNPSLNPELLMEALRQTAPDLTPNFAAFRRVEVYDGQMRPFR